MSPEARWSHSRFSLIINNDNSGFRFVFNLKHKDKATKAIIDLDHAIETKFQREYILKMEGNSSIVPFRDTVRTKVSRW